MTAEAQASCTVVCAVLAAGGSARMGQPKQLLCMDGEPLIKRIVAIACASSCRHVAVVLGAAAQQVEHAIGNTRATFLMNGRWSDGMATSLHSAVRWARVVGADALLLAACDQPHLTVEHLDALIASHRHERRSIASAYGGTLGVPAVLDASTFDQLLAIEGDRGAAAVLRQGGNVGRVVWLEGAIDLDTPVDLQRLTAARAHARSS